MSRFKTLLQREWMQHHRGWLALMLVPPLILLLVVPFGTVDFGPDELGPLPAVGMMLATMFGVPALVLGITAMFFYSLFRNRVQSLISDLEIASAHILGLIAINFNKKREQSRVAVDEEF